MSTATLAANQDTGNDPIYGFYRGRVETNLDPKHLGRVKVRIPQLHGIPNGENSDKVIADEDLPWASPVTSSGTGANHGSMLVPETGDYVFVTFENGDRHSPIYFGGCYGIPTASKQYGNRGSDAASKSTNDGVGWQSAPGVSECPDEAYPCGHDAPNGRVIFKSIKGFIIMINDTDDQESLTIADNDNQQIVIHNPRDDAVSEISLDGKDGQTLHVISQEGKDPEIIAISPDQQSFSRVTDPVVQSKIKTIDVTLTRDKHVVMEAGKAKITCFLDEKIRLEIGSSTIEMIDGKIDINSDEINITAKNNVNIKGSKIFLNE